MRTTAFLAFILGSLGQTSAGAQIAEFPIQPRPSGPAIVAADRDGSVWFAAPLAKAVLHYDRHGRRLSAIQLDPNAFPVGVALGDDGTVWFTDAGNNSLNSLDPATGVRRSYPVPTEGAWPFFVAIDSQNRIWFTQRGGNKIGRFDPRTQTFVEFEVPRELAQPAGMAITPDDHVFFTQNSGHRIGHIAPGSESVREIEIPSRLRSSPHYGLAGISAAPDGDIWFAELDGRLGRILRSPGGYREVREYPLPNPAARPAGVHVDSGGCIWFTELDGNRIVRFNPAANSFSGFDIPTGGPDPEPRAAPERTARGEQAGPADQPARTSRPFGITGAGPGVIWFTQQYGHNLARLDYEPARCWPGPVAEAAPVSAAPSGGRSRGDGAPVNAPASALRARLPAPAVSFALPQPDSVPGVIEADPGGGLWFTQVGGFPLPGLGHLPPGERIARIDTSGRIEQFTTPTPGSAPTSLKVARDGTVWFTERLADRIGMWDPATRRITEFVVPAPGANPVGIAVDEARARIWFTARGIGKIGYLDRRTGQISLRDTPTPNSEPSTIAVDWNGDIWFDERASNNIVRLDPESGAYRTFPVPTPEARIVGVTPDFASRRIWFVELAGSKLGRLDPETGLFEEFALPNPASFPFKLAIGAAGEIYVSQVFGNSIAIWNSGGFTELTLSEEASLPGGVTLDNRGNLWFTQQARNRVSMIPRPDLVRIMRGDHGARD